MNFILLHQKVSIFLWGDETDKLCYMRDKHCICLTLPGDPRLCLDVVASLTWDIQYGYVKSSDSRSNLKVLLVTDL